VNGTITAVALIPAFNEAGTIQDVVRGVLGSVEHVVVVDDGSTDATGAQASQAGAEVVSRTGTRGKGYAIRAGLEAIEGRLFTHVLILDGDMQHLPSEAPLLLDAAARTGADVVLGVRRFDRDAMPASRYHANRIGSRALSSFVGVPLPDTQCGFRVFRIAALKGLSFHGRGYEIETEMLVKLSRRRAHIVTVPITAVYGRQQSKLHPVRDTTRTCFLAVYYRFIERL
jgi:glycosyltransferase involved in cell wall biosynthesis